MSVTSWWSVLLVEETGVSTESSFIGGGNRSIHRKQFYESGDCHIERADFFVTKAHIWMN
jgi:hypothetical protein